MNTVKAIRNLSLGLLAGLMLIQTAQAATSANAQEVSLQQVQPHCETKTRYIWDGLNKNGLKAVTVHDCRGSPVRKVKFWVGPRNTIPIYEEETMSRSR